MDPGIRHEVGLEFGQVHVEGAVEPVGEEWAWGLRVWFFGYDSVEGGGREGGE